MPTNLAIKISKSLATVTPIPETIGLDGTVTPATESIDWIPALKAVAQEVQALNQLSGSETFPRPITCNPDAMKWEAEHTIIVPETTVQVITGYTEETTQEVTETIPDPFNPLVGTTITRIEIVPPMPIYGSEIVPEHEEVVPAGYVGSVEGFIGGVNSIPSSDGMCTIVVENYDWLDLGFMPAGVSPQTFTFILGKPEQAGTII